MQRIATSQVINDVKLDFKSEKCMFLDYSENRKVTGFMIFRSNE